VDEWHLLPPDPFLSILFRKASRVVKTSRVLAIARKEFLHILRDPRSLGMSIAIPMLMLILFGYALTLDVDNIPVAVWDQSRSHVSREFISRFDGSRYFSIREFVTGYSAVERAIDTASVQAAIIVPVDFASRIESGRPVSVQFILDGSDSNTATIALGYAGAVAQSFSRHVTLRRNQTIPGPQASEPLDLRHRVWFNADMEGRNYIVPGLIVVIMMIIAAMLTSTTVAREWESGSMEQLISTPVRGNELILGKMIPYFVIGLFDVFVAVVMGEFLFEVPLRGSVALLFVMASVFLAGALSMGMLVSIVTRNQLLATQLAMTLTFLPSFLLSGFVYAISNMPQALQVMTHVIPARYLITILKGIYLKGVGLEILAIEALFLTIFGAVVFAAANVAFKKRLV